MSLNIGSLASERLLNVTLDYNANEENYSDLSRLNLYNLDLDVSNVSRATVSQSIKDSTRVDAYSSMQLSGLDFALRNLSDVGPRNMSLGLAANIASAAPVDLELSSASFHDGVLHSYSQTSMNELNFAIRNIDVDIGSIANESPFQVDIRDIDIGVEDIAMRNATLLSTGDYSTSATKLSDIDSNISRVFVSTSADVNDETAPVNLSLKLGNVNAGEYSKIADTFDEEANSGMNLVSFKNATTDFSDLDAIENISISRALLNSSEDGDSVLSVAFDDWSQGKAIDMSLQDIHYASLSRDSTGTPSYLQAYINQLDIELDPSIDGVFSLIQDENNDSTRLSFLKTNEQGDEIAANLGLGVAIDLPELASGQKNRLHVSRLHSGKSFRAVFDQSELGTLSLNTGVTGIAKGVLESEGDLDLDLDLLIDQNLSFTYNDIRVSEDTPNRPSYTLSLGQQIAIDAELTKSSSLSETFAVTSVSADIDNFRSTTSIAVERNNHLDYTNPLFSSDYNGEFKTNNQLLNLTVSAELSQADLHADIVDQGLDSLLIHSKAGREDASISVNASVGYSELNRIYDFSSSDIGNLRANRSTASILDSQLRTRKELDASLVLNNDYVGDYSFDIGQGLSTFSQITPILQQSDLDIDLDLDYAKHGCPAGADSCRVDAEKSLSTSLSDILEELSPALGDAN